MRISLSKQSLTGIATNRSASDATTFFFLLVVSAVTYIVVALLAHPATSPAQLEYDAGEYYGLANDLAHGSYAFNTRRTPFYPAILAAFRFLARDNIVFTQLIGAAFFSVSAPLAYLLVRRITGNAVVAKAVAVLIILWPPFLLYGDKLYSETAALPVFICFLLLLPRGSILTTQRTKSSIYWVLAGALLGLCMLIRPMYLLFAPLAVVIILCEERQLRVALQNAVLLIVGCAIAVMPWSAYTSIRSNQLILISANGGETISGGLNPVLLAEGYNVRRVPGGRKTWSGPGKWVPINENGYLNAEELRLPYARQDSILRKRTIKWASTHPSAAVHLEGAKLAYMWGIYPFDLHDTQTLFGNVPTLIFLFGSVAALFRFRRNVRHLSRFWMLPVFVSAIAVISWGSWRFRQPADIGILSLGALFVWSILSGSTTLTRDSGSEELIEGLPVTIGGG